MGERPFVTTELPYRTIEVCDGFIPVDGSDLQSLFAGHAWSFGWKSNGKRDVNSFWHKHFIENQDKSSQQRRDLYCEGRFPEIDRIWNLVKNHVGRPVEKLHRVYANGLTYGLEGRLHTDSAHCNDVTALIYVNPFWVPAWAGETLFFGENGLTEAVTPSPGRLILFNGTTPHVARAPSRDCPILRITLMFKFRLAIMQ